MYNVRRVRPCINIACRATCKIMTEKVVITTVVFDVILSSIWSILKMPTCALAFKYLCKLAISLTLYQPVEPELHCARRMKITRLDALITFSACTYQRSKSNFGNKEYTRHAAKRECAFCKLYYVYRKKISTIA